MTNKQEVKTAETTMTLMFDPNSGVVFISQDFPNPEKHGYATMAKKTVTFDYTEADKLRHLKKVFDDQEQELRAKFQQELDKINNARSRYLQLGNTIDMGDTK